MKTNTQTENIFAWLAAGETITPLEALEKFGCLRLGARIYDLRQLGYNIETKHVTQNGKTFAQYRMN